MLQIDRNRHRPPHTVRPVMLLAMRAVARWIRRRLQGSGSGFGSRHALGLSGSLCRRGPDWYQVHHTSDCHPWTLPPRLVNGSLLQCLIPGPVRICIKARGKTRVRAGCRVHPKGSAVGQAATTCLPWDPWIWTGSLADHCRLSKLQIAVNSVFVSVDSLRDRQ